MARSRRSRVPEAGRFLVADLSRYWNASHGGRLRRSFVLAQTAGVHACVVLRLGQWVRELPRPARVILEPIYWMDAALLQAIWGIQLDPWPPIGPGLRILHSGGIFVGGHIGANMDIAHDVTIGIAGQGERQGVPTIGDNVHIAAGARVFGKIRIGNNVKIGPNAVVHRDVPDNAIVAVAPGYRIVAYARSAESTATEAS